MLVDLYVERHVNSLPAAVWPALHAETVAAPALHLDSSWPQMNEAMTSIFNAEPWLNSESSLAMKAAWSRPSRPSSNTILGSEHDPRSRACRFTLAEAAALHSFSWALQSETEPSADPLLIALAQALFWMAHDRWRAAPALTKVFPLTEKGRLPADDSTAGAAPPRAPVKVWTFAAIN